MIRNLKKFNSLKKQTLLRSSQDPQNRNLLTNRRQRGKKHRFCSIMWSTTNKVRCLNNSNNNLMRLWQAVSCKLKFCLPAILAGGKNHIEKINMTQLNSFPVSLKARIVHLSKFLIQEIALSWYLRSIITLGQLLIIPKTRMNKIYQVMLKRQMLRLGLWGLTVLRIWHRNV